MLRRAGILVRRRFGRDAPPTRPLPPQPGRFGETSLPGFGEAESLTSPWA
jgi:hypothetical protein